MAYLRSMSLPPFSSERWLAAEEIWDSDCREKVLMSRENDDLTVIRGIGPAIQHHLRETLDVRTFSDLAALSADEIESQLGSRVMLVQPDQIEAWINQARELATISSHSSQSTGADSAGNMHIPTHRDEWKSLAAFVVEFQVHQAEDQAEELRITAHHMEADQSQIWSGTIDDRPWRWMLNQLSGQIPVLYAPGISGQDASQSEQDEQRSTEPRPLQVMGIAVIAIWAATTYWIHTRLIRARTQK